MLSGSTLPRIMACKVLRAQSGTISCIDVAATLEDADDGGFAISTAATFPLNTPGSEVGFVDFDLSRERS